MMGMVRPFLPNNVRQKPILLSNTEELLEFFPKEKLLKEYGGTSDF